MKKTFLSCALVCASHLYGMEPEPQPFKFGQEWKTLPPEVTSLILVALKESGNKPNEAIKNIIKLSAINTALNKMINLNDIRGFSKIVHMLADKFDKTPYQIAGMFETPTAQEYRRLVVALQNAIHNLNSEKIEKLIQEGADVNGLGSSLRDAIMGGQNKEFSKLYSTIKLLLDHGLNPNLKSAISKQTPLELLITLYQKGSFPKLKPEEYEQIRTLLEEAMQKYQK